MNVLMLTQLGGTILEVFVLVTVVAMAILMIKIKSKKISVRCTNCGDEQHTPKSEIYSYYCNKCNTIFRKR